MVYYGFMVVVGFSLFLIKVKIFFKYFLKGSVVFVVLMVIVMIMNWVFNM